MNKLFAHGQPMSKKTHVDLSSNYFYMHAYRQNQNIIESGMVCTSELWERGKGKGTAQELNSDIKSRKLWEITFNAYIIFTKFKYNTTVPI